jgi:hypothetical protein
MTISLCDHFQRRQPIYEDDLYDALVPCSKTALFPVRRRNGGLVGGPLDLLEDLCWRTFRPFGGPFGGNTQDNLLEAIGKTVLEAIRKMTFWKQYTRQ